MDKEANNDKPRIVAYFTGYQKIENQQEQPFNPDVKDIPSFVESIDVIALAFVLVNNGTIQYTCKPGETSLCNGKGYWTQQEIKNWLLRVKTTYPNTKFVLSIGGSLYNDWASISNATDFASNVITNIKENWTVTYNGQQFNLIDGLDIDYEDGGSSLPNNVTFKSIIKALSIKMKTQLNSAPILSLPYYGGSPWAPKDFIDIQDLITFVSTMGYGDDVSTYNNLKAHGYFAIKGFSYQTQQNPNVVKTIIDHNKLQSAMFWNLSCVSSTGSYPAQYITVMNDSITNN